jgi:hypothetical protein
MLFDSYHCSRYNTQTGRLTEAMFECVFDDIARHLSVRKSAVAATARGREPAAGRGTA